MPANKVDFEHLMKQATVRLTGVAQDALKAEFYDVLSEFFNDSSCWTQDVTVAATPDAYTYPLYVNEGQIIRLVGVVNWGTEVPAPGTIPQNAQVVAALMPDIGTLVLNHPPISNNYLQVNVVTNVALPTDKHMVPLMPEWVLQVWHVGLLDGLLGKMMTQPGKNYTNLVQGQYHLKRFRDAIARARVSKLRANSVGSQAWRFPQQYRSVSQQGGVPAVGSASERSF
jgi:hypothetical protein